MDQDPDERFEHTLKFITEMMTQLSDCHQVSLKEAAPTCSLITGSISFAQAFIHYIIAWQSKMGHFPLMNLPLLLQCLSTCLLYVL